MEDRGLSTEFIIPPWIRLWLIKSAGNTVGPGGLNKGLNNGIDVKSKKRNKKGVGGVSKKTPGAGKIATSTKNRCRPRNIRIIGASAGGRGFSMLIIDSRSTTDDHAGNTARLKKEKGHA
jgi:hypothetical protein